ncbi:hypothetical protein SprV_0301197700 [Sparganum proliferum]
MAGLCAFVLGTGDAEADVEVEKEEENVSGASELRSVLNVVVEDEAELDEETAAGVVRVLQLVEDVLQGRWLPGTSAGGVGRSVLVERRR